MQYTLQIAQPPTLRKPAVQIISLIRYVYSMFVKSKDSARLDIIEQIVNSHFPLQWDEIKIADFWGLTDYLSLNL